MKRTLFTIFLISILLLPVWAGAAINYYEDFEGETVDQAWPFQTYPGPYSCTGLDSFYNAYYCPKPNCYDFIRDDYTARYGSQYWSYYCGWTTAEDKLDSERTSFILSNDTSWSPCNEWKINNDTEYWLAFSVFIPPDYYAEYYRNMIWQFTQPGNGNYIVQAAYVGGTTGVNGAGTAIDWDEWSGRVYYTSDDHYPTFRDTWTDDRGNWVDFVLHLIWHSTDDADAITQIYMDGVSVFSVSGTKNLPTADPPSFNLQLYNTSSLNDPLTTWNRWYNENGDTTNTTWRQLHIDEFRLTEDTKGTKNYCDVCAPIWAATPTITVPAADATGIGQTFTAEFSGYSDHRTDAQSCFAGYQMNVEVDKDGGDWGTLVYDSGDVSTASSHAISGLAGSTTYQMRVRHSSYNASTTTEYWGEWSATTDFTTTGGVIIIN